MEEIIKIIANRKFSEDFIVINGNREKIIPENFKMINEQKGNFLFVDGGNAELIKSPDLSLQFIRILGLLLKNNSKTFYVSEFYCLAQAEPKGCRIKNVFLKGDAPIEKDFVLENEFSGVSAAADLVRRLSEISMAASLAKKMLQNDIIVLDGTLEPGCRMEADYLLNLHHSAGKCGVNLCSVAKTTSMLTANGNSIISAMNHLAPKGIWNYQINKKEIPVIFFAKLHEKSNYVFKCETNSTDEKTNEYMLGCLAKISKDPIFPGYPFGLIETDRLARVSKRESEILKLELASKFGNGWKNIEKYETALNAHDILDSIG